MPVLSGGAKACAVLFLIQKAVLINKPLARPGCLRGQRSARRIEQWAFHVARCIFRFAFDSREQKRIDGQRNNGRPGHNGHFEKENIIRALWPVSEPASRLKAPCMRLFNSLASAFEGRGRALATRQNDHRGPSIREKSGRNRARKPTLPIGNCIRDLSSAQEKKQ